MKRRTVIIGETPLKVSEKQVSGGFVELDGERFYRISNVDLMPDFFMSIVSPTDQWMFISSNGSLTAGRKNAEGALFPYYPEDKIHDYRGITGSRTLILVSQDSKFKLWEPFADRAAGVYSVRRNLYKNLLGNKLIFEEINEDLSLSFIYGWYNCERFGFVKNSQLKNLGKEPVQVELLDGLQNILPSEVDSGLQSGSSNLLDAYKRQELVPDVGLGIYRLSSVPVDKAEPSEALKVNTVWSAGLKDPVILLSGLQVERFRLGYGVETEHDIKATRGAYFVNARIGIPPGAERKWSMVAEVNQDSTDLAGLIELLRTEKEISRLLDHHIRESTESLRQVVATSDGIQRTNDELSTVRHQANVMFNLMRGGMFRENYQVSKPDFLSFVAHASTGLTGLAGEMLASLGESVQFPALLQRARSLGDPGMVRLCHEYLPLTFSRRHGDPSRPWNRFSIESRKEDGSSNLDYQGNWRDIFQNWEALCLSFPEYVESMISKFVNASTPDGYNPYRITRNGIDWEVPDPSDPWSNIGYWGDHQIIYLLKFLEISGNHHPGLLQRLLVEDLFTYGNVPYRIKPYRELLVDPRNTITFDASLDAEIRRRVGSEGSDGKLVRNRLDQVLHVNLAEKLLVTILSKLSNFIPGAGIWMNTQRPEWNDANNALVGNGVSMVTTYYLRAFLDCCMDLFGSAGEESFQVSEEVSELLSRSMAVIGDHMLDEQWMLTGRGIKTCMDLLGQAGSDYRQAIYERGFSGKRAATGKGQILDFLTMARRSIDITIACNRREDKLFHSYNLIRREGEDRVAIRRLYEMLEGQVAVLSSGFLSVDEAADLLDSLKISPLFRKDQYSYILYPDRPLPLFLEKNNVPSGLVERSLLLKALVKASNRQILLRDVNGAYHFHGSLRNARLLSEALHSLPDDYTTLVEREAQVILDIYEEVFDHQSFTGRSGTFYGYEGLGSIYWHMVSKLLLAVGENCFRVHAERGRGELLDRLSLHYYEIREGIGVNKPPGLYGAFPIDPYSHTPRNRGAQQPGMTGQVKEDIIARWGELGIRVKAGCISFEPILLRSREFLTEAGEFAYHDLAGTSRTIPMEKHTLAFTYCQVPVKYRWSGEQKILLHMGDGGELLIQGHAIDGEHSGSIFRRDGSISRIEVWLEPGIIRG